MNIDSKHRSFIFWKWVNELDPFFWIVTQRIPFVKYDSHGLFSSKYDTKNWTFFEYDSKIWIFWKKKTNNIIQPFFFEYDQRIGFFSWIWRKELNPFSWIWCTELNPFFQICLELNFFFFKIRLQHLRTLLENMTQRIELFISD